jgi:GNAT superfamily N-acetyltransferase
MIFREAGLSDIRQIQLVRNSVRENRLSDPSRIPDIDVAEYITNRGKGWVCEMDSRITGFAIADLLEHNVWALFVSPEYEGKGIGRKLHNMMMSWYFIQTSHTIWLSTDPGTRAERFYRINGWKENGTYGKGEIKFEMTQDQWLALAR